MIIFIYTLQGAPCKLKILDVKLQVIFLKRATNDRALLRKMTCKHKAYRMFTQISVTMYSISIYDDCNPTQIYTYTRIQIHTCPTSQKYRSSKRKNTRTHIYTCMLSRRNHVFTRIHTQMPMYTQIHHHTSIVCLVTEFTHTNIHVYIVT